MKTKPVLDIQRQIEVCLSLNVKSRAESQLAADAVLWQKKDVILSADSPLCWYLTPELV